MVHQWYNDPDVNVPYSLFLWTTVHLGEKAKFKVNDYIQLVRPIAEEISRHMEML